MSISFLSVNLWKQTFHSFLQGKVARMAASLVYYGFFALAPLLIIALGVATLLFGQHALEGDVQTRLAELIGPQVAATVENMIVARQPDDGLGATIIGILLLLFGATGVFAQLKDVMNRIAGIRKEGSGFLRDHLKAAATVLIVGATVFAAIGLALSVHSLTNEPSEATTLVTWLILALSYSAVTMVFAVVFAWLFRFLPDGRMPWRVIWDGAISSAVLFTLGVWLFSLYVTNGAGASPFGAIASLIVVVFWIYYSAIVFLLGFEFTQVWAKHQGVRISPKSRSLILKDNKQAVPRASDYG